jgi:hypothetical protein
MQRPASYRWQKVVLGAGLYTQCAAVSTLDGSIILDVTAAHAFNFDGKIYERINLTNLRSIPLGDRWDGEIGIEKNTITIMTTRKRGARDNNDRGDKAVRC